MTAEVAILNKSGVALATDSAISSARSQGVKIFNSDKMSHRMLSERATSYLMNSAPSVSAQSNSPSVEPWSARGLNSYFSHLEARNCIKRIDDAFMSVFNAGSNVLSVPPSFPE